MRILLTTVLTVLFVSRLSFGDDDQEVKHLDKIILGTRMLSIDEARSVFKQFKRPLPAKYGVVLYDVSPYGPAGKCGLTTLDVVTNLNKKPIKTVEDMTSVLQAVEVGQTIEITGFSWGKSPAGKEAYKKGTLKITPITYREFLFACVDETTDKFKDVTFYRHKESSHVPSSGNEVFAYVSASPKQKPTLRLKMQYVADDWLFVRQFEFKCGSEACVITPPLNGVTRDNARGLVWEYYDIAATNDHLDFLKSVTKAKSASMRYVGRTTVDDRDLSEDEISRISHMLKVYQILLADSQSANPKSPASSLATSAK